MFQKNITTQLSKKPLLIYQDKSLTISEGERRIINLGEIIIENEDIALIKVSPDMIFKNESNAYLTSFMKHRKDYVKQGHLYCNIGTWCKKNSFDNQSSKPVFLENPLLILDSSTVFFNQEEFCKSAPEGLYKISFWYYHNASIEQVKLYKRVTDKNTGKFLEEINMSWGLKTFNILNDWMLCEFDFYLDPKKNIELYFKKDPYLQNHQIMIDDLILRSAQSSIFEEIEPKKWLWNNRPLYDYD